MKPSPCSASVGPYPREVFKCIIRNHKYIRSIQIPSDLEDMPDTTTSHFISMLKKAKTLTKLSLKTDSSSYINIKPQKVQAVLNMHCQTMKVLELPTFSSHFPKLPYGKLKNLHVLTTTNKRLDVRSLQSHRCLENVSIDLRHQNDGSRLASVLNRFPSLKSLSSLSSLALLGKSLELQNRLSVKCGSSIEIGISIIDDEISDGKFDVSSAVSQNVTRLSLQHINTKFMQNWLFTNPSHLFPNLKSLKLGLNVPDPLFMSYLKYLNKFECLEKLSLFLTGCCSRDFSKAFVENLQLPVSIRRLKLKMWLSLEVLATQDTDEERYTYKSFEKNPLCFSFFKMLGNLKNLEKIMLDLQMLDRFRSYYTGFFVSILNQLHNIHCLSIQAIDYKDPTTQDQASECFNMALLLESCSKMNGLKHLEVVMPNLMFENAKLNFSLSQLKSFDIGISGLEEEDSNICEDASKWVQNLIRALAKNAPNLSSLMLDFGEVIDERTLCKRFMCLEKLKDLEMLYMKPFIREFSQEKLTSVGKSLQNLKNLQSVVLRFPESDESVLRIKSYLKYQGSLRDVIVSSSKATWISNGYFESIERKEEQNEYYFDEAIEDEDLEGFTEVELEEVV